MRGAAVCTNCLMRSGHHFDTVTGTLLCLVARRRHWRELIIVLLQLRCVRLVSSLPFGHHLTGVASCCGRPASKQTSKLTKSDVHGTQMGGTGGIAAGYCTHLPMARASTCGSARSLHQCERIPVRLHACRIEAMNAGQACKHLGKLQRQGSHSTFRSLTSQ
jgi:hypothetical protein